MFVSVRTELVGSLRVSKKEQIIVVLHPVGKCSGGMYFTNEESAMSLSLLILRDVLRLFSLLILGETQFHFEQEREAEYHTKLRNVADISDRKKYLLFSESYKVKLFSEIVRNTIIYLVIYLNLIIGNGVMNLVDGVFQC